MLSPLLFEHRYDAKASPGGSIRYTVFQRSGISEWNYNGHECIFYISYFLNTGQFIRMLIPLQIVSFAVDPSTNAPMLLLKENGGERTISVPVGPSEAGAIAIKSLEVAPDHPLTIDLAKGILEGLGGRLEKVVIHDLVDQAYFSRLHIMTARGVHPIECRPSDAISLAMRCRSPIFVTEEVLRKSAGEIGSDSEKLRRSIANLDTIDFGRYYLE